MLQCEPYERGEVLDQMVGFRERVGGVRLEVGAEGRPREVPYGTGERDSRYPPYAAAADTLPAKWDHTMQCTFEQAD